MHVDYDHMRIFINIYDLIKDDIGKGETTLYLANKVISDIIDEDKYIGHQAITAFEKLYHGNNSFKDSLKACDGMVDRIFTDAIREGLSIHVNNLANIELRDYMWSNFGGKPSSYTMISLERYAKILTPVICYGTENQSEYAWKLMRVYGKLLRTDISAYINHLTFERSDTKYRAELSLVITPFLSGNDKGDITLNFDIFNLFALETLTANLKKLV